MKERFSDRIGKTKQSEVLQIDGMSEELKNTIWNYFYVTFFSDGYSVVTNFLRILYTGFLKIPVDEMPYRDYERLEAFKKIYANFKWYEVYNLIEFITPLVSQLTELKVTSENWILYLNKIFKNENSGYRFIDGILAPITIEEELISIENSIVESKAKKMYGTAKHFETAVELFSKRLDPDYRNSIKESISAVESLVKQLTNEKGGGLDKALTILDGKLKFHGGFKAGLLNLYGYTSDSNGIRHSIMDEPNLDFDDAKYMLVSCSAFVNFIISKADKAGLLK